MPITDLNIANMAVRILGEGPIASITTPTTRLEMLVAEFFETVREDTLALHHWNEAMQRATLYAYREPATTLSLGPPPNPITFTAGDAVFLATDVGRELRQVGGPGLATIVTVGVGLNTVAANMTVNFSGTPPWAAGTWRIYNQTPAFGYGYQLALPTDCIRVWLVWDGLGQELPFVQEGTYLLCDQESADVTYIARVTNTALYSQKLVLVMAAHLAMVMAENMTGQSEKLQMATTIFERRLANAQALDDLVGDGALPVYTSGGPMSEDR